MATASPAAPASPASGAQPLGYDAEQRVLELMMQGRSNLAIVNHYKMQDLRLTLSQVQNIRELAGIEAVTPVKKVSHTSYPRGPHAEPEAGAGAAQRRSDETAAGEQCTTVGLPAQSFALPPEFKRSKSQAATSAARTISSFLVAPLRDRGWQGMFVALGLYFIVVYLCFLAVAHVAVSAMHWMLAHKLISICIFSIAGWSWYTFVQKAPVRVRLSDPAQQVLDSYGRRLARAALIGLRDFIDFMYHGGQQHREAEQNRLEREEQAAKGGLRKRAVADDKLVPETPPKSAAGGRPQTRAAAKNALKEGCKDVPSPITSPRQVVWT